jgi:hypothetical protein
VYHLLAVAAPFVDAVRLPQLYAVRQIRLRRQALAVGLLAAEFLVAVQRQATATILLFSISVAIWKVEPLEVMLAPVMLLWSSKNGYRGTSKKI